MKRKCSAKQLKALARGRKIRKLNLKKGITKKKTKKTKKPIRKRYKAKRIKPKKKMTKRRRYNNPSLTGGTKDVNPQYFTGRLDLSAADTVTTKMFVLPVTRQPTMRKTTIIEILRIYVQMTSWKDPGAAVINVVREIAFSTVDHGTEMVGMEDPSVFAYWQQKGRIPATADTTGLATDPGVYMWDFTDGAGHGWLIATDKYYVQGDTATMTPSIAKFTWKILYRFKAVDMVEYVGIVQSQQ